MHLAVGQVPDQPAVNGAEQQLAPLRLLPGALHMVQYPFDLGAAEVGVDQQTGGALYIIVQSLRLQFLAQVRRAAALPYDGVINGTTGLLLPHHGGLSLVGNADGGDLLGIHRFLAQHGQYGADLAKQNFHRVVLYPAVLRIVLGEFILRLGDNLTLFVENDGSGTCGSLVQGQDILLCHKDSPLHVGKTMHRRCFFP